MNDEHILFHVTPGRNIPYIKRYGLIPAQEVGFLDPEDQTDVVWLTSDPIGFLSERASKEWIHENEPYILEVDVSAMKNSILANIRWDEGQPRVIENNYYTLSWIKPTHVKSYEKYTR